MQTYFLSLFATAAVLLAIAIAFLVGFVQLAGDRFTPAIARHTLSDRYLVLYLGLLTVVLVSIGIACLILSLPAPRPSLPHLTRDQTRVAVGVAGLMVIVGDMVVVALTAVRASRYANAPALADALTEQLELASPVLASSGDTDVVQRMSLAVLPLYELLNYAVRTGDRVTFARVLRALELRWRSWLSSAREEDRQRELVEAFRAALLDTVPELIANHGVPSLYQLYLRAVARLGMTAWDVRHRLLLPLLEHLRRATVELILRGEDSAAANGVEALFDIEEHLGRDASREEVERALGTVGRAVGRLLPALQGFRHEAPGFGYVDESASEVLAALSEGYARLCDARVEACDPDDGCVWLEAIESTCVTLLGRGIETHNFAAVEEHAIGFLCDAARAVPPLVYAGNERAAILWMLALERMTELALPAEQRQLWETLAEFVVGLGAIAVELSLTFYGSDAVAQRMIKALGRVPRAYWAGAMQEMQMRGIGDKPGHDARWAFVTKAGVEYHTNFGFMFDAETGALYADDDPRRR